MADLLIRLHDPHTGQKRIRRSTAKRKVIVAGRRVGKTTNASDTSVEAMLKGKRVLYAAPTADQTDAFWETLKKSLEDPIRRGIAYVNESRRIVELPSVPLDKDAPEPDRKRLRRLGITDISNKPRVRCKTAWNADQLRGDYADLLILDEYSLMKSDTWGQVGAPMLLDNNGDAVFIFTPKRKNHAYHMYVRALGDMTGRWEAFNFTSLENPHLSSEALDELTSDMTDEDYRQEILAEFLENEGAVFRRIAEAMTAPMNLNPANHAHMGHYLVMGCDWAKKGDYTTVSVGCADCQVELDRDRFNKIDYEFQKTRIGVMVNKWRPKFFVGESNSMGEPILDSLRDQYGALYPDMFVGGFMTTAKSKPPLIRKLALAVETGDWRFQNDPVWSAELESYEMYTSENTGAVRYSAPEGVNDDTVIARAIMLWAAEQQPKIRDNDFW